MTVRRTFSVVAACLAVLAGAGCSDRDRPPLPAETDEPFYVQGKQLVKQGRNPEALTAFLKVIDRRGERGAAESHLEAGVIYLNHTKDPVEAYHHFRKYLALQPNSKEAVKVSGMVAAARREFAASLPTRPLEDQSLKMQAEESLARLQRENEELRAQIATLRGGGATQLARSAPMISLPDETQPRTPPPPVAAVVETSAPASTSREAPPAVTRPSTTATAPRPVPVSPRATTPTTPTATKPSTPVPAPARGGRSYTVKQSDGLYGIARQFDPANPKRKLNEILEANPDTLNRGTATPLKPGMVLRIP